MNSLSFTRSAIVAFVISAVVALGYFLMNGVLNHLGVDKHLFVRFCLSLATLLYLVYLLKHATTSFGKVSVLTLYFLTHLVSFYVWPSLVIYCVMNVAFIWLVRAVYYHSNALLVLFDLCVCVLSLLVAFVVLLQSGSFFLSLWSFLLGQAFVLPLADFCCQRWFDGVSEHSKSGVSQRFYSAYHQAEDALRKMA